MSRCYPFPPPGYTKAPQPDVAQPHKDKKDRHKDKHKDKKKKKKKDGDTNGEAHDKDSNSRPSKQPRTVSVNDLLLQSKDEKQQNGKVAPTQAPSSAVAPPVATPSTSSAAAAAAAVVVKKEPLVIPPPPPPLYSSKQQELNGSRVVLVLPQADSEILVPSGSSKKQQQPSSSSSIIPPPSNNLDAAAQRRSTTTLPELVVSPPCELLALKPTSTWSDAPDEDWLFAGMSHRKPKAEVEKEGGGASPPAHQVWAEAVFLPSCELYALPYVVPF